MPLTVLHIINNLDLGGAQIVVKQITENPAPGMRHIVFPLRCGQMPLAPNAETITHNLCPYHPGKLKKLIEICREQKVDILHAHLHKSVIAGLLIKNKTNTKLIAHEHGPIIRKGIDFTFYRSFLRCLKRKVEQNIAISTPIADYLQKKIHIPADQLSLVPNAVDLSRFNPDKQDKILSRKKFNLPENEIILGFLGRLNEIKGPDIALETLHHLHKNGIPAHLAFAGTGSMMETLKENAQKLWVSNFSHFLGHIENVPAFLAACDIGLMPSRQEPFGIAGLEWLAMKIPLLTSGAEGLSDFTVHEHNSIVIKENESHLYAHAIGNLLKNPELKTKLTENARKTAQNYSLKNFLEKINSLYRTLIER